MTKVLSFLKKSNQGAKNEFIASFAPKDKMRKNGTNPDPLPKQSLIVLDYLELMLSIGNLSCECFNQKGISIFYKGNECYKLELLPFGGKKWRSAANVYYGNELIGILHFDSIYETQAGKAKFKLENTAFYGEWADITLDSIISNFAKSFGGAVLSVLRVDIALDGCKYGEFAHKVYYHEVVPLRPSSLKGGHWATDKQNWQRINTGFGYGSRQGGRFFRCYDKSLEISEKSTHKGYILDYWQNNNLNQVEGHVWRLEAELRSDFLKTVDFNYEKLYSLLRKNFRLKNLLARQFIRAIKVEGFESVANHLKKDSDVNKVSESLSFLLEKVKAKKIPTTKLIDLIKACQGLNWEHLFDKKRLLSLFQVATKNYFEFVDEIHIRGAKNAEQIKKRLQRAEKIQFIDFSGVHTESYQRIKVQKKPRTDRTAKIMLKQLALSAALTDENSPEKALNYAKAAGLLMNENGLEEYVMKKTHFWEPQIKREAWRRGREVNSIIDLPNLATSLVELQGVYI